MTVTERSEPPRMAPGGSNGEDGPKSTTNPMSLPVLVHWTVVPGFIQKSEFPLAFGMLGVDEAAFEVRFTSTTHGLDAEPQVFSAEHACAETSFEQA
jgi:hypothetical protein